ncbi:MAG: hypothetical protein HC860_00585 [Alkalinema sp. RU_4_3]|nr:hypothetical protein [Alkalinema sp. RU_4_3]
MDTQGHNVTGIAIPTPDYDRGSTLFSCGTSNLATLLLSDGFFEGLNLNVRVFFGGLPQLAKDCFCDTMFFCIWAVKLGHQNNHVFGW